MKRAVAMAVVVSVLGPMAACGRKDKDKASSEPKSYALDAVPPELAAPVARGGEAITALQKRLSGRLFQEIDRAGPLAAVNVCRDEAQTLTAEVARASGIEVGRTSHKLRSHNNAPRAWMQPHVDAAAGKRADQVAVVVVDLGDRIGLLRPLPTIALCTSCHGAADQMAPDLRQALAAAYPDDQATGFAEGDLRGFAWAELPK